VLLGEVERTGALEDFLLYLLGYAVFLLLYFSQYPLYPLDALEKVLF